MQYAAKKRKKKEKKLIQYLSLNALRTEILVPSPWRIDVALDLLEKSAGERFCFSSPPLTDFCLE